jgi:hypothetical protein
MLHCPGTVSDANDPPATFEDRGDTLDPDVRSRVELALPPLSSEAARPVDTNAGRIHNDDTCDRNGCRAVGAGR